MKYIINESKLDYIIYDYLSQNYTPNIGWLSPEFYLRSAINNKKIEFINDDEDVMFVYIYSPSKSDIFHKSKNLLVWPWVYEGLDSLFSDLWIPSFKKWFENNTGLPVEHLTPL